jgi:hypothetical protein
VLLVDDDDLLPEVPDDAEARLVAEIGTDRLRVIDEDLRKHVRERWMKVARIVADCMRQTGFSFDDENAVRLHVRRMKALVDSGVIEGEGNLLRPRWSEVRTLRASDASR